MQRYVEQTHPQWQPLLKASLAGMDPLYLESLLQDTGWLPGLERVFAAFRQPFSSAKYLLLGESPYPRACSANGYAFWDAAVEGLWSDTGLSKAVNRATSLRNFIKMLLVARGDLTTDCSQQAITALDRTCYLQTGHDLFSALIDQGFLLMNACLVYSEGKVAYHAKHWNVFLNTLLTQLFNTKPELIVLLFGNIAGKIKQADRFTTLRCEHPYNVSFIHNETVLSFFKPLDVLSRYET